MRAGCKQETYPRDKHPRTNRRGIQQAVDPRVTQAVRRAVDLVAMLLELVGNHRILYEQLKRDDLQRILMRRLQNHRTRRARLLRL